MTATAELAGIGRARYFTGPAVPHEVAINSAEQKMIVVVVIVRMDMLLGDR